MSENEQTPIDGSIKPFSMDYVLRATARHMRKSVDLSIGKTFERIEEFKNDPKKSREIFETLSALHAMKRNLNTFQSDNPDKFKE